MNSGCYVVDHAIDDPDWGIEYAEKFCNGDCDNCHFHYAEVFLTDDTETFKNNVSNQLGKDKSPITYNGNYMQKEVLS